MKVNLDKPSQAQLDVLRALKATLDFLFLEHVVDVGVRKIGGVEIVVKLPPAVEINCDSYENGGTVFNDLDQITIDIKKTPVRTSKYAKPKPSPGP